MSSTITKGCEGSTFFSLLFSASYKTRNELAECASFKFLCVTKRLLILAAD